MRKLTIPHLRATCKCLETLTNRDKKDANRETTNLNLVGVHLRVSDQDSCIFHAFWLINSDLLVKQKT